MQNKAEALAEIDRVLKPGGASAHLFPSKWSFPVEHHVFVPFASWAHMPAWWFHLWAALGVRNSFQKGMSRAEVAQKNMAFCENGVCYWSRAEYERLSPDRVEWMPHYYVGNADGRVVRMARQLRIPPRLVSLIHGEMMVVRKPFRTQQCVTMPFVTAKLLVDVPEHETAAVSLT